MRSDFASSFQCRPCSNLLGSWACDRHLVFRISNRPGLSLQFVTGVFKGWGGKRHERLSSECWFSLSPGCVVSSSGGVSPVPSTPEQKARGAKDRREVMSPLRIAAVTCPCYCGAGTNIPSTGPQHSEVPQTSEPSALKYKVMAPPRPHTTLRSRNSRGGLPALSLELTVAVPRSAGQR